MRRETFLPLVGIAALIMIWYVAVWVRLVDPVLLPTPEATFNAMVKGMAGGKLGYDFWRTVERTGYAIAIAAVIAIPIGVALGSDERLYRSLEFVIDFFRSTPASAMLMALSAMSSESLTWMCGQRHCASTPCSSGSM